LGRIFTLVPVPLSLIRLVAPDETTDACSEQGMVPGKMPCRSADRSAFYAARGLH
jgi:hypothetical protein